VNRAWLHVVLADGCIRDGMVFERRDMGTVGGEDAIDQFVTVVLCVGNRTHIGKIMNTQQGEVTV